MNRFRNRKKTPEPLYTNEDALHALSASQPAPTSPTVKKSATMRWKMGNKKPIEAKPAVNLPLLLPSNDDFRTSLLMPNLSARFSMLREQDDPNSLLGKAMDDSVLQPRRRSRMDFGLANGGLSDIAEVESSSIKGTIRPPFAANGRQDSFNSEDGYVSDGSLMNRSRPGEGNVLFGGRQKVYMIPKAGASSSRSVGKAVYGDDIKQSAFQQYKRQQELEREAMGRGSNESQGFDFGLDQRESDDYERNAAMPNDSAKDLSHSPSLSSSEKKRSTNSTSHSDWSLTAATSVASQPPTGTPSPAKAPVPAATGPTAPPLKRADTKTRRLYEQGLDQHMQDQQTSAMTRLNSIQRQRHTGNKAPSPYLQSTKSTGNLHEKVRQPVYALRAQSPPPTAPLINTFGSMRKGSSNNASPIGSGPTSPIASPGMELDENMALNSALEPGDRGKATAMGAFNKPKQSFDENQYLERQLQLQRSTSRAAVRQEPTAPSYAQQRLKSFEQERQRSGSSASDRSRSDSVPKNPEPPSAYNVFQRAAQMNTHPGAQQFDKSSLPDTHRTFFGNISASESEEEDEEEQQQPQQQNFNRPQYGQPDYGYGAHYGRWQPTPLPSVSEHPALRAQKSAPSLAEEDEDLEFLPLQPSQSNRSLQSEVMNDLNEPEDSAKLTIAGAKDAAPTSTPLNGLMQHMRQQSDVSSVDRASRYEPPELPEWNPRNLDLNNKLIRSTIDSESRIGSTYAQSNPWDLDEVESNMRLGEPASRGSISPLSPPDRQNPFDAERAPSRTTVQNRRSDVSDLGPEKNEDESDNSWQRELSHTRDASTATQQEREAFAKELEARRTAIAQSIKSKVESDSRSRDTSPAPSAHANANANSGFKPFGMLRSRPSRESIDNNRAPQAAPKAMKMLGISGSGANGSNSTMNSERGGYSLDFGRSRENSASRAPMPRGPPPRPLQHSEQDLRREMHQSRSRENSEASRMDRVPPANRSPASSTGGRSRANSEVATGRSRSRTGPYRDDLEKAMIEGTGSSAAAVEALSPMIPREMTPRGSPDIIQTSQFDPPRARSNSRALMSSYFDSKLQTNSREHLAPTGPPPILIPGSMPSPALSSGRPSPLPSPFAQNMTPPLSGTSTPLSSAFSPPPQMPPVSSRAGVLRKKTISKGDISEPTLVSFTSNIDTVDLPEGASLRNGIEEPPPLPPINPRRRAAKQLFGLVRKDSDESTTSRSSRARTPDLYSRTKSPEPDFLNIHPANRSAPDFRSPRMTRAPKQSFDQNSAMRHQVYSPNNGSPEKTRESPPRPSIAVEGGMF